MHHPAPPTVSLSAFLPAGEVKLPEYPSCLLAEHKPRRRIAALRQQVGDLLISIGLKIKGQPPSLQVFPSPARRSS